MNYRWWLISTMLAACFHMFEVRYNVFRFRSLRCGKKLTIKAGSIPVNSYEQIR
jgi:hypothetical protein